MSRMRLAGAAILLLLVAALVSALDLDTVAGAWSNVVGAPGTFVTVGNETQVRWGRDAGFGQSGLGFTPNASLPLLDLTLGEEFEIGMLRHFNNPTFPPGADTVDLTIALGFSNPSVNPLFTFTLAIDETPNQPPCPFPSTTPCSDRIRFPSMFPSETFFIDDCEATLEIVGFRTTPDGPLLMDFISDEQATNSAVLFGKITAIDTNPPEVFCDLVPVGDDDDLFEIQFSAVDDCDLEPVCYAVLVCGDIVIPVADGELVSIEIDDDECEIEFDDWIFQIEGPDPFLEVICVDESGNEGSCVTGPPADDDDDDDDDDD